LPAKIDAGMSYEHNNEHNEQGNEELRDFARDIAVVLHGVDALRTDISTYNVLYAHPLGRYPDLHIDVTAVRELEGSHRDAPVNEMVNGEFTVYQGAADEEPLNNLAFMFDRKGYVRIVVDDKEYEDNDVARWIAIEVAVLLSAAVDARVQDGTPIATPARMRRALSNMHDVMAGKHDKIFEAGADQEIFDDKVRVEVAETLANAPSLLIEYFQGDPTAASVVNYAYARPVPTVGEVLIGQSLENVGGVHTQQVHIGVTQTIQEQFEDEPVVVRRAKLVEIDEGQAKILTRDVEIQSPEDLEFQKRYYRARAEAKDRETESDGRPLEAHELEFFRGVLEKLKHVIESEPRG
jgi:hypothetical protein